MADLNNWDGASIVDYDAQVSALSVEFDVATATDTTPPAVTLVSPSEGSPIIPSTNVVVDVTDNASFRRVLLAVQFGGTGAPELIHDGDRFTTPYRGSTREVISGGWRYTLSRDRGWPASMRLDVYAIDAAGLEASE